MNDVGQSALDGSLRQAFGSGQLPFCHDPTYRLKYSERSLCSLSQAEQQRCPALRQECSAAALLDSDSERHSAVPPWVAGAAEVFFWLLVGGLVLALVAALLRLQKSRKNTEPSAEEAARADLPNVAAEAPAVSGDTDVQRLLEKARLAVERGELGAAIDAAHAAAVQGLSAAGHLEVEPDRTNGDYLRDLRKVPPLQQQFNAIVGKVEAAQFGGASPTRSAFDQVLEQVLALLRRLAMLALGLVASLGPLACGARPGSQSEELAPSGLYTLKRMLADQGSRVHTRVAPLSQVGDDVGVVLLLSTDLDEPQQKHLVQWVRAGGALVVVDSSDLTDTAEVELTGQPCCAAAERGPKQNVLSLKLAVVGRQTLRQVPRSASVVAQRVDVMCGGSPYVVTAFLGDGSITFIPDRELLTNASLSVADNARLVLELLSSPGMTVELVGPWTGDGSESPMQALKAAGLMPVMLQLLALALLLALRQGTSFGARRDDKQVQRRVFADHVRAVASNYARAGAGRLAAGHYGQLLVDQLRERACPGQAPTLLQLAAAVARRVSRPETDIVRLLVEAKTAFDEAIDERGVNHALIRELEQLSLQVGGTT